MASTTDKDIEVNSSDNNQTKQNNAKSGKLVDPLRLRVMSLNNDFYTLCWSCLRKDIWSKKFKVGYSEEDLTDDEEENSDKLEWDDKMIGNEKLSLTVENLRDIKLYMFCFILIILYVLIGIIHQIFTGEIIASCTWDIRLLRILLVSLVQMKLFNEFREGIVKLKYVYLNEDSFIEVWLAKLIPLFQIICTLLSWITLILFICSEIDPLSMIQDFTGICVFTELDDWIGSHICASEPDLPELTEEDEKNGKTMEELYDFSRVNERISLTMKMSKLQNDTNIIEDLNDDGSFLKGFAYSLYSHKVLIFLIPLVCIPVEWAYLKYHPLAI